MVTVYVISLDDGQVRVDIDDATKNKKCYG